MKVSKKIMFSLIFMFLFSCGVNERNYKKQLQNKWSLKISAVKMKERINDIIDSSNDKIFRIVMKGVIKIIPDVMNGFIIIFSETEISFFAINTEIGNIGYKHSNTFVKSLIIDIPEYNVQLKLETNIEDDKLYIKNIEFYLDSNFLFSSETEFLSFEINQQLQ